MNQYIMPIHFIVKKKKIFLGMNWYRNAHWSIQNPSKELYHKMVIGQLDNILHNKIRLNITLHINKLTNKDLGNITSLHEKYFLDALVENENLPDDCLKYYLGMHTDYIIDKTLETPYVSIEILEVI